MKPTKLYFLYSKMLGGAEIYTINKYIATEQGVLYANKALFEMITEWIGEKDNIRCMGLSPYSIYTLLTDIFRSSKIVLANLGATRFIPLFPLKEIDLYIHEDPNGLNSKTLKRVKFASKFMTVINVPSFYAKKILLKKINVECQVDYYKENLNFACKKIKKDFFLKVGLIGRISTDKNTLNTVHLAIKLNNFYKICINFAGEIHDKSIWKSAEQLLIASGIDYKIEKFTKKSAKQYYEALDMVLHTSKIENMPLVMFEANEYKIPIFMSEAGGISELLNQEFILPDDLDEAANKICKWLRET